MFGKFDLRTVVDQGLAAFGLFDLARAVQKGFQIAVFVDQKSCGFQANPRRARHVIDTIARERLHIDDTFRADAEFLDHAVAVDAFVLHRVEHFDTAADQLHEVLVRGHDGDAATQLSCLTGQCRDDVVGLVTFDFVAGDVERTGCVAGQGELRDQVFGRGRTVGLVFVIEIIAEGFS